MSDKEEKKTPKTIRFIYVKPEDHKLVYVNGAYGGMTPRGDLLCHFFYEYVDIPAQEAMPLVEGVPQPDKGTKIDRVESSADEAVVIRDVRASLIIPAHQITSIANWMLEKLRLSGMIVEKEKKDR